MHLLHPIIPAQKEQAICSKKQILALGILPKIKRSKTCSQKPKYFSSANTVVPYWGESLKQGQIVETPKVLKWLILPLYPRITF